MYRQLQVTFLQEQRDCIAGNVTGAEFPKLSSMASFSLTWRPPVAIRDQVNNEIFFSTLPKEKLVILLKAARKKIKRYVREELQFYW